MPSNNEGISEGIENRGNPSHGMDPPAYPGDQGTAADVTLGEPRLHNMLQHRYVVMCAFFVTQAHTEGRDIEFWNQCVARYLFQWPLYNSPNMGMYLVSVKADIRHDIELASSAHSCQEVCPSVHWEHMFALSGMQFDEVGAQMLSEQSQIEYENRLRRALGPNPIARAPLASPSEAGPPTQQPSKAGSSQSKPSGSTGQPPSGTQSKGTVLDLTWIDDDIIDLEAIDESGL